MGHYGEPSSALRTTLVQRGSTDAVNIVDPGEEAGRSERFRSSPDSDIRQIRGVNISRSGPVT